MNGASMLVSSNHTVRQRVADVDWRRVSENLDARGFAVIDKTLSPPRRSNVSVYEHEMRI